ncbi:MAG: hypothetical protein JRI23_10610 [Deltaproteobacteria bacterium]|jgi:hypothetical protein|nr:hypothetical protein [Deltaproteobacteria bacterium]MBW2532128.1 hypothetical protein [Deltaproteobacteria bacterium]
MNRARWKSIGLLAGMFLLGGVTGASVMRIVNDREMTEIMQEDPDETRLRLRMRAMARQLRLSPEQRRQGLEIFEKYRDQCGSVDRDVQRKQAACRQQARDEMLQILTPDQRRKHQRILERRQRKQQRRRHRGGRP